MSWIVVRVRSNVNVERSIRETMDYLNLTKVNGRLQVVRLKL